VTFDVIFSDEHTPEIIESQFLITKELLIDLGAAIKKSVSAEQLPNYGCDLEEGFNNLNLDEVDILKLLRESTYLKGRTLTAIEKTEWESLSWNDQSIAEKKDVLIKLILCLFHLKPPRHAIMQKQN
jgi:hypothetical protein